MPPETIVTPDGKSKSTFDIQDDLVFAGKGGTRAKKLVSNFERIVAGLNLRSNSPHGPT